MECKAVLFIILLILIICAYYSKRDTDREETSLVKRENSTTPISIIQEFLSSWKPTIERRNRHITKICAKYSAVLQRQYVSLLWHPKLPIGFCRNAKAGSSTWLSLFFTWNNMTDSPSEKLHKNAENVFRKRNRSFQQVLTFSVVRHPFVRLLSAYRNKISKHYKDEQEMSIMNKYRNSTDLKTWKNISKLVGIDISGSPSFREFALNAAEEILSCEKADDPSCLAHVDIHWRPFYDRCGYCNVGYDVISKVETFDEDVLYIILKSEQLRRKNGVGPPIIPEGSPLIPEGPPLIPGFNIIYAGDGRDWGIPKFKLIRKNKSIGLSTEQLAKFFFGQLMKEEKEKIYRAYYLDFLLFNYTLEP